MLFSRFSVRLVVTTALTLSLSVITATADINPKPFVVPELKTWRGGEGQFVPTGRIVYQGGKGGRAVAQLLAADYEKLTGTSLAVKNGGARNGDIVLVLKTDKSLKNEGYRLNITPTMATITAATTRGLQWGTRTLLQLTEQGAKTLPCGVTEDVPEYGLRGFMIDCGRKFIPMSYLRSLVKTMAYYKMNYLQIHLNDNGFKQFFGDDWSKTQAAFRLESSYFPGLTAKDGHYTKQEFIDLQRLAEAYGVEIVPEFDVPAHSLAFTHYRPSIGSEKYGMDHLDLSKQETYSFVDSLFQEYLEGPNPVFRGRRVHIGTDEYSNADQTVVEQFRTFTDHYIRFVEKFGKQAVVWGALTHANGTTPVKSENVVMNIWYNGFAQPRDMKEQGYKLISIPDGYVYIVPAAGYYNDYLNCEYLYNSWTPAQIANEKFDERDPAIEGGMFAVWNDHAGNGISVKDIHDRLFPALQTFAVKCWTGAQTALPYAQFDSLRRHLSEAPGVNEAGRLSAPITVEEVRPGQTLDVEEVGYNYSISFTVTPDSLITHNSKLTTTEALGTVLFESENAKFYLADPRNGKLGFSRDGYLTTFNYSLPKDRAVRITIEGTNKTTRLLVDGREVQKFEPQTLYVINAERNAYGRSCGNQFAANDPAGELWHPEVYAPSNQIHYYRTLVFPLRHAGQFKSHITGLKVEQR